MIQLYTSFINDIVAGDYFRVVLEIGFCIAFMLGLQKIFEKMGEKGWKAFVPIYNIYVLSEHIWERKLFFAYLILSILSTAYDFIPELDILDIISNPIWFLVAFVGIFIVISVIILDFMLCAAVSREFGRKIGTTIGLYFLNFVFIPILGYGEAEYAGAPDDTNDAEEVQDRT